MLKTTKRLAGVAVFLLTGLWCASVEPVQEKADLPKAPGAATVLSLQDVNGVSHAPLDAGSRLAVVLVFTSPFCPTANTFTPEIKAISEAYADRFSFYFVEADADLSFADARKHAEIMETSVPVLLDSTQQLVRLTGATVTPEAAILSSGGEILYRGRINDLYVTQTRKLKAPTTHDLRSALDAVANGKPVQTPRTKAIGCSISMAR